MFKKWMILAGCFFGGILICGLGAGIGFVEFSHFTYVGDRLLGSMQNETLTFIADDETDKYYIDLPWRRDAGQNVKAVSDNSLPEDTIEIDLQYSDDYEKPYLYEEIYDVPYYDTYEYDEADTYTTENPYEDADAAEQQITKESWLGINMYGNPAKIIMRYKDVILEDIKNDQIGSYSSDWSQSIRIEEIRYHPSLEGKIELRH